MAAGKLYLELAKARLTALVLLTTLVGYVLALGDGEPLWPLFWTVLGTGLAAAGANALNQWLEVDLDARMERTRDRPLPSGRVNRSRAFGWGLGSAVGGVALLAVLVNLLAAGLAATVVLLYTLVYTPLKQRSTLCTVVGAVCGAIPPLIGWAAAAGRLELGAWLLAATLFVWQIPHFFSLAWIYRRDYARGGFRMLPVIDPGGRLTFQILLLFCLVLLPLGLTVYLVGVAGPVFALGSLLLGGAWTLLGLHLYRERSLASARRVFLTSLAYLPLLLGLMLADRGDRREFPVLATEAAQPAAVGTGSLAAVDQATASPISFALVAQDRE